MHGERSDGQPPGLRILLVEDEMTIAFLIEGMIEQLGHHVIGPIARVEKGLKAAQHEMLDAAILDVNINGTEVFPIADALAARGIPFIFASGYGSTGVPATYRDAPVLQKPYRFDDLRAAIVLVSGAKST